MEPENNRFGGGVTTTFLFPVVGAALVLVFVLTLLLPRKYVHIPWLLAMFFIPSSQIIVLAGQHFTITRILVVFGLLRLFWAKLSHQDSALPGGFNPVDKAVTMWGIFFVITFSLAYMQLQALINQFGHLLHALGGYFVLRWLIQDWEDVRRVIKLFAYIALVTAMFMLRERATGQSFFWQGSELALDSVRDGSVRAHGAFASYLLAGSYAATLVPLLFWLWWDAKYRVAAFLGMVGATVMVIASSSSTSVVSYAAGIFALCYWPFRKQMRLTRWGIVFALVALQLVMKTPVWHLIAKVDLTGSSSSFHRYILVDNTIRHFKDWWLVGTKDYANWGWDMWDTSDEYVSAALKGGLATLIAFFLIIIRSLQRVGTARKAVEGSPYEWPVWCLGAAMFAHVVGYIGIGYEGESMEMAWFALLVIIPIATGEAMERAAVRVVAPDESRLAPFPKPNWGLTSHKA